MSLKRVGAVLTAVSVLVCGQGVAQQNEGRGVPGASLLIERGISYREADGQNLALDIYRMNPSEEPSPVVVWIGDSSSGVPLTQSPAPGLIRNGGVAVASIEYRESATLAEQLADARVAVAWLRSHAEDYNLDPERMAAFGFGNGARLAALLGTTAGETSSGGEGSNPIQAVVALAGPMASGDLRAVDFVTPDDAPTLLIHGTADSVVSTLESQTMVAALKVAGVTTRLDMPMAVGHDLGELLSPIVWQSVAAFIDQQLMGEEASGGLSRFVSTPPETYIDPVALDLGGTTYELFPSPARGADTQASYRIYLPPGYEASGDHRYPVIYMLHGRSVDSKRSIDAGYVARVDAAIRSGVMPPAIVVLPQGLNRGWYVNTEDGERVMEDVIIQNLVPHIDANYRTIATREARVIEGHSMGGYGALHLAFKYPQLFSAATGNSAALVGNAPDDVGSQEYWESQKPVILARQNYDAVSELNIRIIIGTEDGLIAGCRALSAELTAMGIDHEFIPVQGSPHNIDQLLQYEDFDRMAIYGELFSSL
jgi:enterochelin esterase-like enzyme/acetyl esterase/lipase